MFMPIFTFGDTSLLSQNTVSPLDAIIGNLQGAGVSMGDGPDLAYNSMINNIQASRTAAMQR